MNTSGFIYINESSFGKGIFDFYKENKILYLKQKNKKIKVTGNITGVTLVSKQNKTGGGVTGAAGGALLGFLVAGPVGTAIGAGMGSKKKGLDQEKFSLTFADGNYAITSDLSPKEIAKLQVEIGRVIENDSQTHQQNLTHENKTVEKKKEYIPAYKQIKKRKNPRGMNLVKGRTVDDANKLENGRGKSQIMTYQKMGLFDDLQTSKEIDPFIFECFKSSLELYVRGYNAFNWLYLDRELELESEIKPFIFPALQNIVAYKNELDIHEKKLLDLKDSLQNEEIAIGKLDKKFNDLISHAGSRFSLGKTSDGKEGEDMQIKTGTDFFKTRDVYQKVQGIFEIINKKLDLFAKSKKINPNIKKPKHNYQELYYASYVESFDAIEDKRFNEAVLRLKKEEERRIENLKRKEEEEEEEKKRKEEEKNLKKSADSKSSKTVPTNHKSRKDRLIELKSILDDGLVSKEEYDTLREAILSEV
ncbi:hypothetical protein OAC45_03660 [Gammaproteobacteria bacterium]|nr:hypothetical protein [Gammaproteobacteria bacterium]|tara:strand:- start:466 stop:1890 length:1425 start_codon:yes stop_codon:yes gene_type:complete